MKIVMSMTDFRVNSPFKVSVCMTPCAAGKLIGRFYTETGQPTDALLRVEAFLSEGLKKKAQAQSEMQLYPACNSEWSEASGGRVWCSTMRYFDFFFYLRQHSIHLLEKCNTSFYSVAVAFTETGLEYPECFSPLGLVIPDVCASNRPILFTQRTETSESTRTVLLKQNPAESLKTELQVLTTLQVSVHLVWISWTLKIFI